MKRILSILSLIVFILFIWAFYFEPSSFRIDEEKFHISRWPKQCNGIRIAILADLHVGSPFKGLDSLKKLVKDVNDSKPDLILLAGDFVIQGVVGGSFVPPEEAAKVLSKLEAPSGVFAVLGNHDHWLDSKRVYNALSNHGIRVLEDSSDLISFKECKLQLVGISDYWEGKHDIAQALKNTRPEYGILAFTHNPDIFPELPKEVILTIAGHTHGGQVFIPGIGRPQVPSKYGERYAIGKIIEDSKFMYVSSGVGTSILPVRFLVPPKVDIIEVSNVK